MLKNIFAAISAAFILASRSTEALFSYLHLITPNNNGRDGWEDVLAKQHKLFLTFRRYACRFLRLSAKKETDAQPEEPFYYQTCEA